MPERLERSQLGGDDGEEERWMKWSEGRSCGWFPWTFNWDMADVPRALGIPSVFNLLRPVSSHVDSAGHGHISTSDCCLRTTCNLP